MAKKSFWQRSEDYAKKVSNELIDQIKRGVAPWQKPWKPGAQISAENFSTGKRYTGGNSLYLMSRGIRDGRGDNRWGTYNQIREAGGQVRKGERGTLKIAHRIVWETGPGADTRKRVEAVKRWFVHDWQTLDNKVKSSIVEGVSVFLAMFDMPDVAQVFCPEAPEFSDDPEAIEVQAQIWRFEAEDKARRAAKKAADEAEKFSVPKHFLKSY